jgi:WD40 repeat protein
MTGRMTRIFTDTFGYERVTSLNIDPELAAIRKKVRDFCLHCGPEDVVALYYTGHANEVNGTHRLWTGDTDDYVAGTLPTGDLAELMLLGTPLRYGLVILDTCFAGKGGAEAIRASVAAMGEGAGKTLALLTAAYPREQIVAGDFARLFEDAVGQRAVAGYEPPYLALGAIARLIDNDDARKRWQTISYSVLFARTDLLPFFPNPRFNPQMQGLDLFAQLQIEEREMPADYDMRAHFLPRARGVDVPAEQGWRFVGREAALRDLVGWLRDSGELSVRVVTGGPGSGKSAVIGRLAVLSDPGWRRTVPMEDLPPDTIPPEGSIAAAIHARGKTTAQILAAVCEAAGVRAETPADLIRELHGRRLTVVIDAVDEALDPGGLVSAVLRPLVKTGPAEGLRLLLGTRPHLLESLGLVGTPVNLDDQRYADPESLYEYVRRGLTAYSPLSPYRSASAGLIAAVAKAVAEAAGHSFLVALIVSRTLSSAGNLPDPADPGWQAGLPATAADAMHQDLEFRLGADADRARELLRPLAFAAGAGFPWEDLWAPMSSVLSGHGYTDEDLIWLRRNAGSYVIEAMEAGHSVYRLYHAALAEYLRQDYHQADVRRVHRQFYEFLVERVPASRSGLDWSRAHPYILSHLATHARLAGTLDELLVDPRYLVNASPAGLLAAIPDAASSEAELAGQAYQRAVHQFREQPEQDRFSYLELAARIAQADELLRRLAAAAAGRRWSVPWTQWPPEYPHRILDGHLGNIGDVICVLLSDGSTVVASIGADAKLRLWDAATAEPRGTYAIGDVPLIAIQAVTGSANRVFLVLLSAAGQLHFWDLSTASELRSAWMVPHWRRLARSRYAGLMLDAAPDGRPYVFAGGRGLDIRTTVWEVPSGRRAAVLPFREVRDSAELTELDSGEIAVLASMGGTVYRLYGLRNGHLMPRRRWSFFSQVTYYGEPGVGPPLVAARFFRARARLWDVSTGASLGTWDRGTFVQVRLASQRMVALSLPARKIPGVGATGMTPGSLEPLASPAGRSRQHGRVQSGQDLPRVEARGRFLTVTLPASGPLTLAGHTADITGYDVSRLPDGRVVVVSGSYDGTVRLWDVSTIPRAAVTGGEPAVALHRIVSVPMADGTPLGLTVGDDPGVGVWNLRTGGRNGVLHRHQLPSAVAADGDPPIAVICETVDQTLEVWDLSSGKEAAWFPADRHRWPSGVALARLPDGVRLAITSGHGRRTVVWDLGSGRMRDVLSGHRGRSAAVACAQGAGGLLALTAGEDNRVNVWDLGRRRRSARFRIVPFWRFLTHPSAGHANSVLAVPLDTGELLVLIATSDGMVRSVLPRGFPHGVRRAAAVEGDVTAIVPLGDGQRVVVTAGRDGLVRIWTLAALAGGPVHDGPLCAIDIAVPVSDIAAAADGVFVIATPNGLTAIQLDLTLLRVTRG